MKKKISISVTVKTPEAEIVIPHVKHMSFVSGVAFITHEVIVKDEDEKETVTAPRVSYPVDEIFKVEEVEE